MDPHHSPASATSTERVTTSKAKRYLVAAALLGGGMTLGAVFSPLGLAEAQSDGDSTDDGATEDGTTTDDAEEGERRGRRGHHHRRGASSEALSDIIGLPADDIRERMQAGETLAQIAESQGVSEADLVAGLQAELETRLDEAVAEGRIDEEKAAEKLADAEERLTEMVNADPSEREGRRGRGHRGPGRFGGTEVLDELGISSDELRAGFTDGKTLAEIAEEQGVAEADLVDALVAAATARVDEALADGRIDEDRAAEITEGIDDKVDEMIDATPGDRDGRGRGFRGHRGPGGGSPDGETEGTSLTST